MEEGMKPVKLDFDQPEGSELENSGLNKGQPLTWNGNHPHYPKGTILRFHHTNSNGYIFVHKLHPWCSHDFGDSCGGWHDNRFEELSETI